MSLLENKVGDELDVFVYCDSEDRLRRDDSDRPLATVGEAAFAPRWWTKRSTALSSTGA
ncbi:MAG: S1-like domain-containing RNA-binding protein [Alistipes indistinctus]